MASPRKKPPVPAPKPVSIVCTVCGLDWAKHGADATLEDCVRLLKSELARKPHFSVVGSTSGFAPTTITTTKAAGS